MKREMNAMNNIYSLLSPQPLVRSFWTTRPLYEYIQSSAFRLKSFSILIEPTLCTLQVKILTDEWSSKTTIIAPTINNNNNFYSFAVPFYKDGVHKKELNNKKIITIKLLTNSYLLRELPKVSEKKV